MKRIKFKETHWLMFFAFLGIIIISSAVLVYRDHFGTMLSDKTEVWGQFGDFLNVFIGISNLIIVTTLTWVVFDAQQKNDKIRQEDLKKEYGIQKLRYLENLISKSIKFSQHFIENLTVFNNEIQKNPIEIPLFIMTSNNEIDILVNKINQEDYFHAYVNHLKSYDIVDIFTAFDVIAINYKLFIESLSKHVSFDYERKIQYKSLVEQIVKELRKIIGQLRSSNMKASEEFIFLNQTLLNYHKGLENNPEDLFQFRDLIYTPLLEFLIKEDRGQKSKYQTLLETTSAANKSLTPIIQNNKKLGNNSAELSQSINEILDNLKTKTPKLLEYIESLKNNSLEEVI